MQAFCFRDRRSTRRHGCGWHMSFEVPSQRILGNRETSRNNRETLLGDEGLVDLNPRGVTADCAGASRGLRH
jgi:hypothetical protein